MTPEDLRKARRALDKTQYEMSRMLQVHESTYQGWESGTGIPGPAKVAVHYMLRCGILDGLMDGIPEWRSP